MANFKPNKQQLAFLEADGSNLLVSASAGSGKTSTMVQKLVGIISNLKVPITSLLVVTYTNAAASEIKQKLFNEISQKIVASSDTAEKAFLEKQLDNLSNAEIGTLHAICKKLIIKYFYEVEQTPDFSLLSDKESKYLFDMAVSEVVRNHIQSDDESFFELYDSYNSKRNDSQLRTMILQIYNYKIAKLNYEEWEEDFIKNSYNDDLLSNNVCQKLLTYYQFILSQYLKKLKDLRIKAETFGHEKYFNFIDMRMQFVDEFKKLKDFETAVKVLNSMSLCNKPTKSKNADVDTIAFDEEIDRFNDDFSKTIKNIKDDFCIEDDISEIKNSILKAKSIIIKLLAITAEVESNYTKIKKSKNSLDFNDLEEVVFKLLESNKITDALKEQYKYVFVDEYQDINEKQEAILSKIVSENNYYMIGDVKQSIYAFRQSSPKIFVDKYDKFAKDGKLNRVINFNVNYRSDKNILEFANFVFDTIITKDTIGIDYKSDARFESDKCFVGSNVTLDIIDAQELDDKEESEAKLIIEDIEKLLATRKASGEFFEYRDIAVILRSRGSFVKTLCDMLSKKQIPVKTSVASDFFSSAEVQLLVSILNVVSNYQNDVAMAIVLKNLFNITEDEFLQIHQINQDVDFYKNVQDYSYDDAIKVRLNKFWDFVCNSRNMLTRCTIKEYLNYIIDEFQIALKYQLLEGGDEKAANIAEFVKIADNSNYEYSLDKFLDYLNILSKDNNIRDIGDSDNAIEICTIHHSKGLEYPAVILGRLGQKFQLNKDSGNIIFNSNFGIGVKSIDSNARTLKETVVRSMCKIDNIHMEINEEIRLLYVAMTRAKEKLFLTGVANIGSLSNIKIKPLYATRNYLELILRAFPDLYLSYLDGGNNEFVINENLPNEARVTIHSGNSALNDDGVESKPLVLDMASGELVEMLNRCFATCIDRSSITIKNTVTNILQEEKDYENINYMPRKLDESDHKEYNSDALRLGTAYHAVMQEVDFARDKGKIEEKIECLVQSNIIEKAIAKDINIKQIEKAIDIVGEIIDKAQQVYREKQFLLCENYNKLVGFTDNNTKVIVQGVIDLACRFEDGSACIIDYKTNRVNEDTLVQMYGLQLNLYAKAFEAATGVPVQTKYLYSFHLGKLIRVD